MNKMRKKGAMRLPKSTTKLKQYFPMIREREDIKREIRENPKLLEKYREWDEEQQEEFLDYCTGVKGEKKKAFSYKDINSSLILGWNWNYCKNMCSYRLTFSVESTTIILGIRQKRGSHF